MGGGICARIIHIPVTHLLILSAQAERVCTLLHMKEMNSHIPLPYIGEVCLDRVPPRDLLRPAHAGHLPVGRVLSLVVRRQACDIVFTSAAPSTQKIGRQ